MSTWGWLIEYGIMALIVVLLVAGIFALWGQDRLWRWQDHREAKRQARATDQGRRGTGTG